MTEQRYGYTYHRVLIDSTRVLDPQFGDSIIYVTGAQLELLRNMTQYLNRLSTYVSEYQPSYYLSPTVEDYDSIRAIVADLEETLMGNPNTIWGISERWVQKEDSTASGSGDVYVLMDVVPAGEIWVLEDAYAYHNGAGTPTLRMYSYGAGEYYYFVQYPTASPTIFHRWNGRIVLTEGDLVACWVVSPGDGVQVNFNVWGHKMIVSTS